MSAFPISAERVITDKKMNIGIIVSIVLLWGLGMVTLYITSGNSAQNLFQDSIYFVKRQVLYSLLGFGLLIFITFLNLDVIRKILPYLVFGSLLLCILAFAIGAERNGARRWIDWGGFSFQPSQFPKVRLVIFLANLFAKKHDCINDLYESIGRAVLFLVLFVFAVYLQNDFSTSAFILLLGLFMFFIAGVKMRWFISIAFLLVSLAFCFIFTEEYRIRRVISFLRPESDPYGNGFQAIKAKAAVTAGGFFGQDSGIPERFFSAIPEVQSDFVLTGWMEEMGFVGMICYFAVLLYFAWCGVQSALECKDRFRSLVAFGATAAIFFQSIMNCGVITGIFPATGIPLPFFSAGGSSLIASFCFCALIANVTYWNSQQGVGDE